MIAFTLFPVTQLLRYAVSGAFATAAHYLVLGLLIATTTMSEVLASTAGAIVGACVGYALNARWTFGDRHRSRAAFLRYSLVGASAVAANGLLLDLLQRQWDMPLWPAQISVTVIVFAVTFALNRQWTFAWT